MRTQQRQEGGGSAALTDLLLTDHTTRREADSWLDFIVLSSEWPDNVYLSWMECVLASEIWGMCNDNATEANAKIRYSTAVRARRTMFETNRGSS